MGFFVWESLYGVDAWVSLTPPSRMRPWKLASQALTLDQLSNGRAQLAVGLGAPETGFADFGGERPAYARRNAG